LSAFLDIAGADTDDSKRARRTYLGAGDLVVTTWNKISDRSWLWRWFSLNAFEGFTVIPSLTEGDLMNLKIHYRKLTIELAISAAFLAMIFAAR
jgi:hypothetical protein